ncbi:MAG TPA: DEAD/DEAH box helicase [Balneolaceae bacterium]|nr:DEAD/DEAH box helicase [Balneolaceae bacterium]
MTSFRDLGLSTSVTQAVQQLGFEQPMPIQQEAIPLLLTQQTDLVALAQTGTGKTAAFGLPLVERIEHSLNLPQALVIAPTRELCMQITRDIKDFSQTQQKINTLAVYGGSSIKKQINALNRGVQIIAATPGRLLDLLRRGKIDTSAISTVVLDEADELLNMGFQHDLNAIFDTLPKHYNTWLFSATMPNSVARIAKRYMHDPERITIGTKNAGTDNVSHQYLTVKASDRYTTLRRLIDLHPDMYGIIFCRTRRNTRKIAKKLRRDGYQADAIHGDLSQSRRDRVMGKFRSKNIQLMVATDVASRGIDVDDITHIINYELPDDLEKYTHRSGRTGRAGKTGVSIGIAKHQEKKKIRKLEKTIKQKFERIDVPTAKDVKKKRLEAWTKKVKNADPAPIQDILPAISEQLEDLDRDALIAKFSALAAKNLLSDDKSHTSNNKKSGTKSSHKHVANGSEAGFERFFINIGKKDSLNPGQLISLIDKETGSGGINIGKIDIMGSFSFFEADVHCTDQILAAFQRKIKFHGRHVNVEIAKPKK